VALKSDSVNNVKVDTKNARAWGVISATADTDVVIVAKVGSGKPAYVIPSDTEQAVLATADAPVDFDSTTTGTVTLPEGSNATTISVKAGKFYYVIGVGTNLEVMDFYDANAVSTETPTEATTAEVTTEATTTAAATEATTTAAVEASTEATTTVITGSELEKNAASVIDGTACGIYARVADGTKGVVKTTVSDNATQYTVSGKNVGDTFNVDLVLKNNADPLNALTMYFDYDPTVVQAVGFVQVSTTDGITYKNDDGDTKIWMSEGQNPNTVTQLTATPSATNADYLGFGADGTKTAAELGRIKFANARLGDAGTLPSDVKGEGVLVTIQMRVLKEGTTKLEVSGPSGSIIASTGSTETSVNVLGTAVYGAVSSAATETTTVEATTEATTAATTEATTSANVTTEATTEATTAAGATTEATTSTSGGATVETTTVVTTTDATTQTTTDATTETTTKKSHSSSGGGSSSSSSGTSSSKASGTTKSSTGTKVGTTTSSKDKNSSSSSSTKAKATVTTAPSFVAPNGTVITAPALMDSYGNVYAGASIPSSLVGSKTFTDTSARAWAESSIEKLAALGIVNGVGSSQFAPDSYCKRADFIVMLVKALGLTGTAKDNFDDVVPGKYYTNAVGLAKEVGIATGYGNGNFGPENTISRQDMMVLVAKTLEFLGKDITASTSVLDKFSDSAKIANYAKPYASYLVSADMVSGTGSNIEPVALMTRAQLAVLVDKLYDAVVELAPAIENEETTVEESTEETTAEDESSESTTEETTEETTETTTEA
jgi:hypothetical protein